MPDSDDLVALLSSSGLIFAGVILTSVATLVERIVIARAFDLAAYGEVSIGLAIMSIATSVSLVGLTHGVPRFVSRFDDDRDVRGVWLTALVIAWAVSGVLAALLYVNVNAVSEILFESTAAPGLLRLFVLAIPVTVGFRIAISAIRGLENTRYKILVNDLLYPGFRLLLLAALVVWGLGIEAAGYAYLGAALVGLVAGHLLFDRLFSLAGGFRTHARTLVTFSAPLVVSMLFAVLLTRMDTLMLASFRSSEEVGLYSAAYPLATSLLVVVSSFGYLYLPLTSRLDADGRREEVGEIYRLTTKWGFVLTFPAFLLLVTFGGDVLALVFEPEYRAGGLALVILSVGFFTSAALGRNRETLSALGNTNEILVADTVALALNLILNLVLIPPYGIEGAAVASASSYVARNAVIYAVLRRFGITPFSTRTVRTYLLVPVALIPPFLAIATAVTLSVLLVPVLLAVAALGTVAVVLLAGCLGDDDLVAVEFLEERIGVRLPFVRRYIWSPNG